ncbi:hypothetical protein [Aquisalinus flavus]|uniref:Uncharacterized protein n=1 Tax=Aquisalinus flavus TaxID=1526572 RepID=A0A8J2V717_9PROT|nr:hypothetical protein [Aquisalinus flavus]MBD0427284.1 hypothetical protein [Aquisalinus flavus]UNE47095.1 hypothetical protein FF099_02990 [Aquisalinus flavus]GGC99763.1 hypothetical protein GCM10011342_05990 [Aquisalinus flavus]
MRIFITTTAIALAAASSLAQAQEMTHEQRRAQWEAMGIEDYQPPAAAEYEAALIEGFPAIEAGQGAAADADHFYAIVNYVIGKYDRQTGELVGRWKGPRGGPIGHLNSCYAEAGKLYCANSNHPNLPMGSSIEIFDTETMTHEASKSLGMMDEGSLVWFDHYKDGWIAGFAHYDDETGLPFKDHTYASIVLFDDRWRRTGGYMLPASILEKMAPQAASGGAMGDDGYLYVMGHDLPEMYVLRFPQMGPSMEHVATISVPAEGQAFAFDPENARDVWAISRPARQVRHFTIPPID